MSCLLSVRRSTAAIYAQLQPQQNTAILAASYCHHCATESQWVTLLSRDSVGCVARVRCSCEGLCVKRSLQLHGQGLRICCQCRLWMVTELLPLQSMVVLLLQGCKVMLIGVLLLNGQKRFVCGFMGAATSARSCALQCSAASALGNQNRTLVADRHLQLPI